MPPTTGTPRISFNVDSAMNCTTTSGQFAPAMSAPRLRAVFSAGAWDIDQFTVYLCGILLDEWLCPFPTTVSVGHARSRC